MQTHEQCPVYLGTCWGATVQGLCCVQHDLIRSPLFELTHLSHEPLFEWTGLSGASPTGSTTRWLHPSSVIFLSLDLFLHLPPPAAPSSVATSGPAHCRPATRGCDDASVVCRRSTTAPRAPSILRRGHRHCPTPTTRNSNANLVTATALTNPPPNEAVAPPLPPRAARTTPGLHHCRILSPPPLSLIRLPVRRRHPRHCLTSPAPPLASAISISL
jgi:hypothetical protein